MFYQFCESLLSQIRLFVMWQSEEIHKVSVDVVHNSSEGGVGEILYHCHSGKEQSKGKL